MRQKPRQILSITCHLLLSQLKLTFACFGGMNIAGKCYLCNEHLNPDFCKKKKGLPIKLITGLYWHHRLSTVNVNHETPFIVILHHINIIYGELISWNCTEEINRNRWKRKHRVCFTGRRRWILNKVEKMDKADKGGGGDKVEMASGFTASYHLLQQYVYY